MFSQRHYVFIAKLFSYCRDGRGTERDQIMNGVALLFASEFAKDNPKFDSAKFFKAAGCEHLTKA